MHLGGDYERRVYAEYDNNNINQLNLKEKLIYSLMALYKDINGIDTRFYNIQLTHHTIRIYREPCGNLRYKITFKLKRDVDDVTLYEQDFFLNSEIQCLLIAKDVKRDIKQALRIAKSKINNKK